MANENKNRQGQQGGEQSREASSSGNEAQRERQGGEQSREGREGQEAGSNK